MGKLFQNNTMPDEKIITIPCEHVWFSFWMQESNSSNINYQYCKNCGVTSSYSKYNNTRIIGQIDEKYLNDPRARGWTVNYSDFD